MAGTAAVVAASPWPSRTSAATRYIRVSRANPAQARSRRDSNLRQAIAGGSGCRMTGRDECGAGRTVVSMRMEREIRETGQCAGRVIAEGSLSVRERLVNQLKSFSSTLIV